MWPWACHLTLYLMLIHIISVLISGDHKQKFYWGHKEILLPVYKNMADAMKKHPEVDVLISFASLRSAYDSTIETMQYPQVWDQHQLTVYIHMAVLCSELNDCLCFLYTDSHNSDHSWRYPGSFDSKDHQNGRWKGSHYHWTCNGMTLNCVCVYALWGQIGWINGRFVCHLQVN